MEPASSLSWVFKPDSTTSQLTPSHSYQHTTPSSLNKSPHKSMYSHSPSTSQAYTSPLTPRGASLNHMESPYRAGSASPHSSAGLPRPQSVALSQDLLLPMMPSTEESKLHATVSGLRFALQDSQLQLGRSHQQVEALQQRCTATDAQAAQLHQQLTELQGDKALLGARLHDGSLDMVKGQLIQQLQQQLADSSKAAEAAAGQSQQAALQLQSLQDQLSLQQQAQASERERLSMEAAQSRLLCKARARQVSSLEMQCKAETSRAEAAVEEAQTARDQAARSISDSMLQQDAAMKQAQQAREAAAEAHHQLQKAQQAQLAAEQQRQQAEDSLRDVRLHMDWQDSRIADLESQDVAQTARRYDSELQSMKLQLQQERQRLEAQLQQEKRAREVAETQLHSHATMAHSSKGSGPNSGNLGSPRKGRENSSPNKPRGSSSLQESVVLKAQLQQARDAAERDSAHWRAALEDERHTCEKLRQQLNQLEESDQLVATAAANSQQQVHHLRQQLESEKTRAAMLDANLQAAAHSVRSSKTFKRRQRSRYTVVQDSARMDDGHVDDRSWQHALGLTDNETSSSAEEDEEADMDLTGQAPRPVMVTVGLQTDDVALTALLAGTAGKDSLMTAARQEILRLKDVNSRLLEQRSTGVGRGAVVAEKEAEAAVAAARAAACQQQEQALQRCNAEWTHRLDSLRSSLQEAKAEAQRVRDCQAELARQHQTELQQVNSASEQKAAELQADLAVLQQRIAAAEAELTVAQTRVQQLEQQLQAQLAEASATEKRMAAQMDQLKMDADTDLAMLMLESSSNASESASRLDAVRATAEASKQAAIAELQQQLHAERKQRVQLQQQLQASTAAGASPCVTDAVPSAETAAAAEPERQTGAAEQAAVSLVPANTNPDSPQGITSPCAEAVTVLASVEGQQPLGSPQAASTLQPAGKPQAAIDVAVQTDLHLMHLPTPDAACATSVADQAVTPAPNSPAPKGRQQQPALPVLTTGPQLLAGSRHHTTDSRCGPDSCESLCNRPTADASCGPESCDSPHDQAAATGAADSSTTHESQQAHSMHSSSGHRQSSHSSSQQAMRDIRPDTADSYAATIQASIIQGPEASEGVLREGSAGGTSGQKRVSVNRQSGEHADGHLLERKGKAKGEAQWSRGLQLPQKLSIASLAKHAGVDRAFMQEWVASVKVPSEEATALTRMADAAAAAAAFTAEGLKSDHTMLTEQAQRAELAKRAQQGSGAVLRGDCDAVALQEADRRSYSRWSGLSAGEDDMCRTSSAVATPESSYATARAAPVALSHHSVSSGHSSRKGHMPPVYTTSPIIAHHRLHHSSALHSAASPIATALPFSPSRLTPPPAHTPRFAMLGALSSSNQQKSMLGEASSHVYGDSYRLHRDASPSPADARASSSHSQFFPDSPQRFPPNSMGSSFQSPADADAEANSGLYSHSRLRGSEYPQTALTTSPVYGAPPSSPYQGAVPDKSPLRSPAHAAAVSAVEQQLHASLHQEQGLLPSAQGRPTPNSHSALPAYYPSKEHTQDRLNGAGVYQPWRGHLSSQQHSGQQHHDGPDSLSQPSRLSQVSRDSHLLSHTWRPLSQHLGHASPELDSLSQRLRDQKVAMEGQSRSGISPVQGRATGFSPNKGHTGSGAVLPSTGLGSTYKHTARPDPSPSRLGRTEPGRSDGTRSWTPPPQPQATSHLAPAHGRSWGGLAGSDVSSDLQASMYHKERSRLQEALARQHAMSAVSSSRAPTDPSHRAASPWDSPWDQQSAAAMDPSQRQLQMQRQHNQGAFGSIVSDYRPAARLSPLQSRSDGVSTSHRSNT